MALNVEILVPVNHEHRHYYKFANSTESILFEFADQFFLLSIIIDSLLYFLFDELSLRAMYFFTHEMLIRLPRVTSEYTPQSSSNNTTSLINL